MSTNPGQLEPILSLLYLVGGPTLPPMAETQIEIITHWVHADTPRLQNRIDTELLMQCFKKCTAQSDKNCLLLLGGEHSKW